VNLSAWPSLVGTVLAGTGRQAPVALEGFDPSDREGALLAGAALLGTCRRAGALGPTGGPAPPDADESAVTISDEAEAVLARCLAAGTALLDEWMELASREGTVAPSASLPDLLDLGRSNRQRAVLVRRVLGSRGQWLARLNPGWSYALAADAPLEERWQEGNAAERLDALPAARAVDPAMARGWLEEAWSAEGAKDRAALLACLREGLSIEDVPFLTAVLKDRSAEVRGTAIRLLAVLPDSEVVQVAQRAVAASVHLGRSLLKRSLEVELPPILPAPLDAGFVGGKKEDRGERARRLTYVVGLVPPDFWTAQDASITALLDAAKGHEEGATLFEGWAHAAVLHRNSEWAGALLEAAIERQDVGLDWESVAAVAGPDRLQAMVRERLGKPGAQTMALLWHVPRWNAELSRALVRYLQQKVGDDWLWWRLGEVALRLHPSVADEALGMIMPPEMFAPDTKWRETLSLRRDMHAAFARGGKS